MSKLPETDVVIIGVGAVGGIVADVFTQAGLNVVGIEAGPYLTTEDFASRFDELGENSSSRNSLGGPKFNREIPTWRLNAHSPSIPPAVGGMANCVGGSSVHYSGTYWRFLESDFTLRSSTIARYGAGALPAGAVIKDWPLDYGDLEPYYDKIEHQLGVSGDGSGNPFQAPRRRDYPMPPLRAAGYPTMVSDAMKGMGYHPFPLPAAINSVPYQERNACTYCGFCTGFGCWNGSKSSTLVTSIPDALATDRLDLRPDSRVMEILSDPSGRVTGVTYMDAAGHMHEQPARFVVLSSYLYENNRLLLLSKSTAYPKGLANNHDQVGKHYRPMVLAFSYGLYPDKQLNQWTGATSQSVAIDDFNGDNFDHHGLGFIRGANISVVTNNLPIGQSAGAVPPDVPLWGSAYKRWLHEQGGSVCSFIAQMETLPYEANFIDLDPVKKDDLGVPVVRLTFNVYENELKMAAFLTEKMAAIHRAAGATKTWGGPLPTILAVFTHAYGGTVMGTDPETSVVDEHSVCHEAPNLAIMGGSTYVNNSGYNPTETMQAIAWRSADYIAKNFDALAS